MKVTAAPVWLILLVSCQGLVGGLASAPGDTGGNVPPPTAMDPEKGISASQFTCSAPGRVEQLPVRRLSRIQYVNAIRAAVTHFAGPEAKTVWSQVEKAFSSLPPDRHVSRVNKGKDGFERADQLLTQTHADAQFQIATSTAALLAETAPRRERIFGNCAVDADTSNDVDCIKTALTRWIPILLRRPVQSDDSDFYVSALRGTVADQAALTDVLALLLAAPEFVFHIEPQTDGQPLPLPELASRLAFALTDAPPDEQLRQHVLNGDLANNEVYQTEAARLIDSAAGEDTNGRFFSQWLVLQSTPDLTTNLNFADYKALVGNAQPSPAARQAMIEDLLGAVKAVYQGDGSLAALLNERRLFTTDAFVAELYGVAPWDGQSAHPVPADAERAGLLARPALVASGSASSHPIIKGVRIRTQLLCDELGEAPPNAITESQAVKIDGPATARQLAEAKTAPSGCQGCHFAINGLGFAAETFDSLGRLRTEERVFKEDGTLWSTLPLNTTVTPRIERTFPQTATGLKDLTALIQTSKKFESCFARQYFLYSFQKSTEADGDQCLLASIEHHARAGLGLKSLMQHVVTSADFKSRN
jgi:Protein of unknown function (DUF1592)/Protein of unknown function (DUF1588)/Protein of unknown function (DUF1585)